MADTSGIHSSTISEGTGDPITEQNTPTIETISEGTGDPIIEQNTPTIEEDSMPNFTRRDKLAPPDDLEIASRVMDTVQRQVASYRLSLEKLRMLRKEIEIDRALSQRIWSSPQEMAKVFVERGIPEALAVGMAAEDFQDARFGGGLGFWTWDCCCTECCITNCNCTIAVTTINR